jgi:hypothetical protein
LLISSLTSAWLQLVVNVLHRILGGEDADLRPVEPHEAGVERRRLAGAGRPRHEENAGRPLEQRFEMPPSGLHVRYRIDGVLRPPHFGKLQDNLDQSMREIASCIRILCKLEPRRDDGREIEPRHEQHLHLRTKRDHAPRELSAVHQRHDDVDQ